MDNSRTGSMRMVGAVCVMLALALVAAFGMAAAVPQSAQAAGKVKVWVLDSTTTKTDGYKLVEKIGYTGAGLVKSVKQTSSSSAGSSTYTELYGYNANKTFKSYKLKTNGKLAMTSTLDKNGAGYVTKINMKPVGSSGKTVVSYTYNKKGRPETIETKTWSGTCTYNSKGYLKTMIVKPSKGDKVKYTYAYDGKGMLKVLRYDGEVNTKYANSYKNNRLIKRVAKNADGYKLNTQTYKYRQISVSKSLVKYVKAQQRVLLTDTNDIINTHK